MFGTDLAFAPARKYTDSPTTTPAIDKATAVAVE
jgi:hypothetical protein